MKHGNMLVIKLPMLAFTASPQDYIFSQECKNLQVNLALEEQCGKTKTFL